MIYNVGGGAGGALVHINVSYDQNFVGETITLTNGTETHTFIGDNTLSKVVNCNTLGEWTVSCNGHSASIATQFYGNYDVSIYSTVEVTVYSASNDTVYYYPNNDSTQSPVTLCTTNASGVGTGEIPVGMITLYSTVAKDTETGINAYSKSIYISDSTTEIKVMPDGVVYWYGYTPYSWTGPSTGGGHKSLTLGTNYIYNSDNLDGWTYWINTNEAINSAGFNSIKSIYDNGILEIVFSDTHPNEQVKVTVANGGYTTKANCTLGFGSLSKGTNYIDGAMRKIYAIWLE